ncbi:MAG: hypothetical protein K2X77_30750 [Candidatus Obscuribacterales bacterium]|nr:hypothetical protein [Candidatus Obscuribacterales bacterium]
MELLREIMVLTPATVARLFMFSEQIRPSRPVAKHRNRIEHERSTEHLPGKLSNKMIQMAASRSGIGQL